MSLRPIGSGSFDEEKRLLRPQALDKLRMEEILDHVGCLNCCNFQGIMGLRVVWAQGSVFGALQP